MEIGLKMKVGRKHGYDPVMLPGILSSVKEAKGSLGQVADLNRIHRMTFHEWVTDGDDDHRNNISSDLAQLAYSLRQEQAKVVIELAAIGIKYSKKSRFIIWWLGRICREDFGEESEEIKKLKDLVFNQLLPLLQKGELNHGGKAKEMDPESD